MWKQPNHTVSLGHFSKHQVGLLTLLKLHKMAQVESVEPKSLAYQKVEKLFEDRDTEVFDTIMLNGPIDVVKKRLKLLKDQGSHIHNIY